MASSYSGGSGLPIRTCARQKDGATRSGKPRCRCRRSELAFVLDFVLRKVGAERFVEAFYEAGRVVVDEIVEVGFEIGLEDVFAIFGEDEAEFFVGLDV